MDLSCANASCFSVVKKFLQLHARNTGKCVSNSLYTPENRWLPTEHIYHYYLFLFILIIHLLFSTYFHHIPFSGFSQILPRTVPSYSFHGDSQSDEAETVSRWTKIVAAKDKRHSTIFFRSHVVIQIYPIYANPDPIYPNFFMAKNERKNRDRKFCPIYPIIRFMRIRYIRILL